MNEKEIQTHTKEYPGTPSQTEVAKELKRIEEVTKAKDGKESHRETLEEEFGRKYEEWQEDRKPAGDITDVLEHEEREKDRESQEIKELVRAKIEFWESNNENYIFKNFDQATVKITNSMQFDVPVKFFDYLIGQAITILDKQETHFGEVIEIEAKIDFKEPAAIKLLVKDLSKRKQVATSIFYYGIRINFPLRRIDSSHGIFNLKN